MSETKEKFNPLAVKIIIPFGRFASKLTKGGEKKLFIAREKTRALLIDRLISGESRGAYLVTGRRGVGKTSFVEACLEEYSCRLPDDYERLYQRIEAYSRTTRT